MRRRRTPLCFVGWTLRQDRKPPLLLLVCVFFVLWFCFLVCFVPLLFGCVFLLCYFGFVLCCFCFGVWGWGLCVCVLWGIVLCVSCCCFSSFAFAFWIGLDWIGIVIAGMDDFPRGPTAPANLFVTFPLFLLFLSFSFSLFSFLLLLVVSSPLNVQFGLLFFSPIQIQSNSNPTPTPKNNSSQTIRGHVDLQAYMAMVSDVIVSMSSYVSDNIPALEQLSMEIMKRYTARSANIKDTMNGLWYFGFGLDLGWIELDWIENWDLIVCVFLFLLLLLLLPLLVFIYFVACFCFVSFFRFAVVFWNNATKLYSDFYYDEGLRVFLFPHIQSNPNFSTPVQKQLLIFTSNQNPNSIRFNSTIQFTTTQSNSIQFILIQIQSNTNTAGRMQYSSFVGYPSFLPLFLHLLPPTDSRLVWMLDSLKNASLLWSQVSFSHLHCIGLDWIQDFRYFKFRIWYKFNSFWLFWVGFPSFFFFFSLPLLCQWFHFLYLFCETIWSSYVCVMPAMTSSSLSGFEARSVCRRIAFAFSLRSAVWQRRKLLERKHLDQSELCRTVWYVLCCVCVFVLVLLLLLLSSSFVFFLFPSYHISNFSLDMVVFSLFFFLFSYRIPFHSCPFFSLLHQISPLFFWFIFCLFPPSIYLSPLSFIVVSCFFSQGCNTIPRQTRRPSRLQRKRSTHSWGAISSTWWLEISLRKDASAKALSIQMSPMLLNCDSLVRCCCCCFGVRLSLFIFFSFVLFWFYCVVRAWALSFHWLELAHCQHSRWALSWVLSCRFTVGSEYYLVLFLLFREIFVS